MNTVYVTATLKAKPGMEKSLEHELAAVVSRVRSEKGCLRYDLHKCTDHTSTFLFYEIWESKEALDIHASAPTLTALQEKIADMLVSGEVTTWSGIDTPE
ncbi:putative quinol monooxygenase [Desulfosediminicola sp.]|uniref:putative quinol monooxygenase n=1 Tax=Desulfosediminicola sp. TaxID=2886825 RepID=UPI003AF1E4CC